MASATGPIFIGGPHRSGTGMLRAVIGSNSQIAIPPKEYLFFDLLGSTELHTCEDQIVFLKKLLSSSKIKQWNLINSEVEAFIAAEADKVKALYAAPLRAYAHQSGKPRFGEKTPYLEQHFCILLHWFGPAIRFLHMIRDPLNTYRSMMHYRGFQNCPGPEQFTTRWRASVKLSRLYERLYPENYLLIRYEDFIEDSPRWTKMICNFSGLPLEIDRMLQMSDFERKQNSSFIPPNGCRRDHNQIVRPSERERPLLPESIRVRIEEGVFPCGAELGY